MLLAASRGGVLDAADAQRRRDAWIDRWEKRATPLFRGYLWFAAYAADVQSRAEAESALAALPRFSPLARDHRGTMSVSAQGAVYFLAGQPAESRPLVEAGAKVCRALEEPVAHTRAQLSVGLLREQLGDGEGACAAFRVVLGRWGGAKLSRTAATARAHASTLRCLP